MHPPVETDDLDDALRQTARWLARASRVAVLTGAGVSAESGVPTFRDANGLWEGHDIEEVASPLAFARQPELVWRFYNQRRANLAHVRPNPGHLALSQLEERFPAGDFALITQNVDGLHRRAGSRNVLELHGNLAFTRCTGCRNLTDRGTEPLPDLPHCDDCGAMLRPEIVWFGEALPEAVWDVAMEATYRCDVFLTVGTSAVVHPAAGLIGLAKRRGAKVVEVNPKPTAASGDVDVRLVGLSGVVLPKLVEMVGTET
jgi:NAD-dependent deacetylase